MVPSGDRVEQALRFADVGDAVDQRTGLEGNAVDPLLHEEPGEGGIVAWGLATEAHARPGGVCRARSRTGSLSGW